MVKLMKKFGIVAFLILLFLIIPSVHAASVTISQAGADPDTVMKGKTFTVTVSGLSGSGQVTLILPSGFSTDEDTTKQFSTSSVSWTTVVANQKLSGQTITATISTAGSPSTATSSSFDVVLPPSISINSYSPSSYTNPTGSRTIQLNIKNTGETTARDVVISLSLPSGVSLISGSQTQTIDISANENWATSWRVNFGSGLSSSTSISISITPSNADAKSVTIPITISEEEEEPPSAPGGPSVGPGAPPEKVKNASKRFELIPGVGLRNNTKLQKAIEKVLAKGKLSEEAIENLMRLSESIVSDTELSKDFKIVDGKSQLSLNLRYKGEKKVKNFVIYDKVPKTFAEHSDNITVSSPGASIEIVEEDPEYVFLYPEVSKDQVLTITYSVDKEVDASVINETETEIYAESYEGLPPGMICSPGERRCEGNDLQECSENGKEWKTIETCEYGCEDNKCKSAPPTGPPVEVPPTIPTETLTIVVIIIVIIVIVVGVLLKKKKKYSFTESVHKTYSSGLPEIK
jgi:uncharacterized repeat protein (TIGR01451 family)